MEMLGCPTVTDLKPIIQANQLKNTPVTLEDIETMEAIHGPHVPSLKGKTTRNGSTTQWCMTSWQSPRN